MTRTRSFAPSGIRAAALALAMAGADTPGLQAGAPGASELEVKSAMLYNFIKFVEWPPDAMAAPAAPFVVGVVGSGSFAAVLSRTVGGHTVQGRPVVVKSAAGAAELASCHVVFVAGGDGARGAGVIGSLRQSAVLTVGESPGFARRGGVIGFVIVDNRTNFEINVAASARAGLKVSSKLLRLATVVQERE